MRKRIVSLFLTVVLCMAALVPAALAGGLGETRVGFTVGGHDDNFLSLWYGGQWCGLEL